MISTSSVINCANPVNRAHPLNLGRVAWWLAVPGLMGGAKFHDLMSLPGDFAQGNHGTLNNMTTSASGWRGTNRPGGFGYLQFDGTDDYVETGNLFNFAGSFTLACGARFDSTPSSSHTYQLISKDKDGANQRGWALSINNFLNINVAIYKAGDSTSGFSGTPPLLTGIWYRLVMTYQFVTDGTSLLRAFINGVLNASISNAVGPPQSTTNTVNLGRRQYSGFNDYHKGALDDCSVWSRALSPAEVADDYRLGQLGYPGLLNRFSSALLAGPPPVTTVTVPPVSILQAVNRAASY
jgi:hypothetical protein